MNSITEFKSEFSQTMRGYSPAEVDAAVEMLVSYGAELESANAEFAEVNAELIAENEALAAAKEAAEAAAASARAALEPTKAALTQAQAELTRIRAELEAAKAAVAAAKAVAAVDGAERDEAKATLEATRRATAELKAKAEVELSQIRARRTAEETRYNMVCRKTTAMTAAIRRVWTEQIETLDAIAGMTEQDDALDATPAPAPIPEAVAVPEAEDEPVIAFAPAAKAEPEPATPPAPAAEAEAEAEDGTIVFTVPQKAAPQRVRRSALAAAALEPEAVEVPAAPARRPEPAQPTNAGDTTLTDIFADAPTQQFTAVADAPHVDGVNVDIVYLAPKPAAMKVKGEKTPETKTSGHNFSAVRRSLEEIGAKLKK